MTSSITTTAAAEAGTTARPNKLQYSGEAMHELLTGPKLMAAPLQLIALPEHPHSSHVPQPAAGHVHHRKGETTAGGAALPLPILVKLPKVVREYPMPGARETHEMAIVGDNMLVVTQQTNSTLVKVQLCPVSGRPVACARFVVGDFWHGLHGLAASHVYPGHVWASLQFKSLLVRINPGGDFGAVPTVEQVIKLPSSVNGPHCVCECGRDLWTSCKDSGHVVRINHTDPDHDFSVYPCSRRPIFIAMHPISKDVYASLDLSSKIWRLELSTGRTSEIDIPTSHGTTPVGLVSGPDGNVWFTLLGGPSGGNGTFACISAIGGLQFFSLTTRVGARAGLIHLAFDWDYHLFKRQQPQLLQQEYSVEEFGFTKDRVSCMPAPDPANLHRLWLLSSSLVAADPGAYAIDAVFTVLIDSKQGRIVTQHSISLPTQHCANHRILPHRTGLFVSQLAVSSLAHITGTAALQPADVTGETTDMYNDFGMGGTSSLYVFAKERVSRSALLGPAVYSSSGNITASSTQDDQEVLDFNPVIPAMATRRGKRARAVAAEAPTSDI